MKRMGGRDTWTGKCSQSQADHGIGSGILSQKLLYKGINIDEFGSMDSDNEEDGETPSHVNANQSRGTVCGSRRKYYNDVSTIDHDGIPIEDTDGIPIDHYDGIPISQSMFQQKEAKKPTVPYRMNFVRSNEPDEKTDPRSTSRQGSTSADLRNLQGRQPQASTSNIRESPSQVSNMVEALTEWSGQEALKTLESLVPTSFRGIDKKAVLEKAKLAVIQELLKTVPKEKNESIHGSKLSCYGQNIKKLPSTLKSRRRQKESDLQKLKLAWHSAPVDRRVNEGETNAKPVIKPKPSRFQDLIEPRKTKKEPVATPKPVFDLVGNCVRQANTEERVETELKRIDQPCSSRSFERQEHNIAGGSKQLQVDNFANMSNPLVFPPNLSGNAPVVSRTFGFPAHNINSLPIDPSNGFHYDANTGLHYDSNSGYFYDGLHKVFLYWDELLQNYALVENSTNPRPLFFNTANQSEFSQPSSTENMFGPPPMVLNESTCPQSFPFPPPMLVAESTEIHQVGITRNFSASTPMFINSSTTAQNHLFLPNSQPPFNQSIPDNNFINFNQHSTNNVPFDNVQSLSTSYPVKMSSQVPIIDMKKVILQSRIMLGKDCASIDTAGPKMLPCVRERSKSREKGVERRKTNFGEDVERGRGRLASHSPPRSGRGRSRSPVQKRKSPLRRSRSIGRRRRSRSRSKSLRRITRSPITRRNRSPIRRRPLMDPSSDQTRNAPSTPRQSRELQTSNNDDKRGSRSPGQKTSRRDEKRQSQSPKRWDPTLVIGRSKRSRRSPEKRSPLRKSSTSSSHLRGPRKGGSDVGDKKSGGTATDTHSQKSHRSSQNNNSLKRQGTDKRHSGTRESNNPRKSSPGTKVTSKKANNSDTRGMCENDVQSASVSIVEDDKSRKNTRLMNERIFPSDNSGNKGSNLRLAKLDQAIDKILPEVDKQYSISKAKGSSEKEVKTTDCSTGESTTIPVVYPINHRLAKLSQAIDKILPDALDPNKFVSKPDASSDFNSGIMMSETLEKNSGIVNSQRGIVNPSQSTDGSALQYPYDEEIDDEALDFDVEPLSPHSNTPSLGNEEEVNEDPRNADVVCNESKLEADDVSTPVTNVSVEDHKSVEKHLEPKDENLGKVITADMNQKTSEKSFNPPLSNSEAIQEATKSQGEVHDDQNEKIVVSKCEKSVDSVNPKLLPDHLQILPDSSGDVKAITAQFNEKDAKITNDIQKTVTKDNLLSSTAMARDDANNPVSGGNQKVEAGVKLKMLKKEAAGVDKHIVQFSAADGKETERKNIAGIAVDKQVPKIPPLLGVVLPLAGVHFGRKTDKSNIGKEKDNSTNKIDRGFSGCIPSKVPTKAEIAVLAMLSQKTETPVAQCPDTSCEKVQTDKNSPCDKKSFVDPRCNLYSTKPNLIIHVKTASSNTYFDIEIAADTVLRALKKDKTDFLKVISAKEMDCGAFYDHIKVVFKCVEDAGKWFKKRNGKIVSQYQRNSGRQIHLTLFYAEEDWKCWSCRKINFALRYLCFNCCSHREKERTAVKLVVAPTQMIGIYNLGFEEKPIFSRLASVLGKFSMKSVRLIDDPTEKCVSGLCVVEADSVDSAKKLYNQISKKFDNSSYVKMADGFLLSRYADRIFAISSKDDLSRDGSRPSNSANDNDRVGSRGRTRFSDRARINSDGRRAGGNIRRFDQVDPHYDDHYHSGGQSTVQFTVESREMDVSPDRGQSRQVYLADVHHPSWPCSPDRDHSPDRNYIHQSYSPDRDVSRQYYSSDRDHSRQSYSLGSPDRNHSPGRRSRGRNDGHRERSDDEYYDDALPSTSRSHSHDYAGVPKPKPLLDEPVPEDRLPKPDGFTEGVYPLPDINTFLYNKSINKYFDPMTSLYYDPDKDLFYNDDIGAYLMYRSGRYVRF